MKRVAVFIDASTYGGAERVTATLLRHLDRERWSPVLIDHGDPGIAQLHDEAAQAGVAGRIVPRMADGPTGALRCLGFARLLRAERFDVLHVQLTWPLSSKYALAAGILAGVPAVLATAHCVDPDVAMTASTRAQQWVLGHRVGRYIAVSRYVKDKLTAQLPWPAERIEVIRNGVEPPDPDRPRDPQLRAALAGPLAMPVVLATANLFRIKGIDVLIEAAALVPQARFAIAGEGPERSALERRIAELGIADRVTLLGWREDVTALLLASDLFVLPSRRDALSLSALESLAAGTPVVTTGVGGMAEVIEDHVNGLVVAPEDPAALAAAITELLAEPARREAFAAEGRRRFTEQFSAESMVARIENTYTTLLGTRSR